MLMTKFPRSQVLPAWCRWVLAACALVAAVLVATTGLSVAAENGNAVPLVIGNRTIHVFRASLGAFTPEERVEGARQRITSAIEGAGAGWTSVKSSDQGVMVLLDGKPMFTVAHGDVRKLSDDAPEDLANNASRVLQKVWSEAR